MIRDPSDGSVRPPLSDEAIELLRSEMKKPAGPAMDHEPTRKFMMGEYDTGLPLEPTKDKAKLEKSRQFIRDYFRRNPEQGT